MADKRISGLPAVSTAAREDLLLLVDDPAGIPSNKKISLTQFFSNVEPETVFANTKILSSSTNAAVIFKGGVGVQESMKIDNKLTVNALTVLNIATITQYDKNFPLDVMFPKEAPKNTLGDVISKAGLSQVHTAETEKYAHVTFFFNGGVEDELKGEKRVLIPSPNVATYDMKPEMSAVEVCQAVSNAMNDNEDFIVVNFANGDMVGHTGDFEAGIKAVECVDTQLGILLDNAKQQNYNVIITSDHGNCEKMKDENGDMLTNHTVGDVFCFIIANGVDKINNGSLNNIAPTVLKLMNLPIPEEMDEPLY